MSPQKISGNPAKAAEQRTARAQRQAERQLRRENSTDEAPRRSAPARLGAWALDWLPFVLIGFATMYAMFATSMATDGDWGAVISTFLVPLAFTFLLMPFEAFAHRVWRWGVVFFLAVVTQTFASYIVVAFGIAWLLHQTYRVEYPATSRVHHGVEALKAKFAARRTARATA